MVISRKPSARLFLIEDKFLSYSSFISDRVHMIDGFISQSTVDESKVSIVFSVEALAQIFLYLLEKLFEIWYSVFLYFGVFPLFEML